MNQTQHSRKRYAACPKLVWRLTASILLPCQLLFAMPSRVVAVSPVYRPTSALDGKSSEDSTAIDRQPVDSRTSAPIPKTGASTAELRFSASPTDDEISRAIIAGHSLVPTDGCVSANENEALARALIAFSRRVNEDDTSSLESFLKAYPNSRWQISLLAGLATNSFKTGYFSKTLAFLEKAWKLGRDQTDPNVQEIVNWIGARLANLNTQLGRADQSEPLLHELYVREISGPATELITSAAEGLWLIKNRPEEARRCGPAAAAILYRAENPTSSPPDKLQFARATSRGASLNQVGKLLNSVGLAYQMAKRTIGSTIVTPCVVNWKVGHFAAILRREGDKYLVADPTFGEQLWVSAETIDAEASGYFLIPVGKLPGGWKAVTRSEGSRIWGAGTTPNTDPNNTKPCDTKAGGTGTCSNCPGMARYSFHAATASLNIVDTPLFYSSPPRGPSVSLTVTYNHRDANQPAGSFPFSNLGPKWTFNWLSFIIDDSNNPYTYPKLYVQGGGGETYKNYHPADGTYDPGLYSQAVLVRVSGTIYERRLPDGSKETFDRPDTTVGSGRRVFLTRITDPAGNSINFTYDANFRVTQVIDAVGQTTNLYYADPIDIRRITSVEDPFHRVATFEYFPNAGRLKKITDMRGLTSEFTYGTGLKADFITSLTTPYGTTNFQYDDYSTDPNHLAPRTRWLQGTDPLGGIERVDFNERTDNGIPNAVPDPIPCGLYNRNSVMYARNTFFWSKKAMTQISQSCRDTPSSCGANDYSKAQLFHWLHTNEGLSSGIIESEKKPLEARIWYNYPGQPQCPDQGCCPSPYNNSNSYEGTSNRPTKAGRVLDDGTTQLYQYEYNATGKVTRETDPVRRVVTYVYDPNNIDLLQIRQTTGGANELVRSFVYNSQHEPLTDTDAAGQTTTYSYNDYGQVLTRTNAKNETTTFAYGGTAPNGYLASIAGPQFNGRSPVTSFTYDSANRVRTVTDSDGYTVTTDYDNLDRPTQIAYPDGTNQQFKYSQDFGQGDRSILDLTKSKDRRGLWTTRHYNANRQMDSIIDPQARTTLFGWCTCGLLTSITDPKSQTTTFNHDVQSRVIGKSFADNTSTSYAYENTTSRMKSMTDALNQTTNYQYFADNDLKQVSYTNAIHTTPTVNYTYDSNYNRVLTMMDGTGTTTYAYYPITAPSALGAGQLASIDGPLANDTISLGYDELGRVRNRSINGPANSATWTFDTLGRINSVANKLGTFSYSYVDVTNRLSRTTYPGSCSSVYTYLPNAQNKRLQEIRNQAGSASALISQFDYTYDAQGQILTWTKNYPGLSPAPQYFDLGYDNADQVLTAPLKKASGGLITQYTYGYDLAANRTSELVGTITTTSTPNSVNEIISQSGGTNRTLTYDANGSLTNDGLTRTFEWDAANRLTAINYSGGNRSEFTYDGLSRCVKIVENAGLIVSTRKFVWCGMEKCEFRDANDAVTAFVYPQGQYSGTTPYFYSRDHLGSIREMFKSDGTVVARYDYDPWGRSTTVVNTALPDFNFTGLYRHSQSKLDLAVYRAYDPDLGRWISRDPLENAELLQGTNLYGYVSNDPINYIDSDGRLFFLPVVAGIVIVALLTKPDIANAPENPEQARNAKGSCGMLDMVGSIAFNPFIWSKAVVGSGLETMTLKYTLPPGASGGVLPTAITMPARTGPLPNPVPPGSVSP